ncbi:gas vesicle protein [Nocardioides guangzhouensis]|uniref:Gas vesicle protein n=1 Tax=Nocardioides guangzhouensis TaxID=2497878 RepID=A0A4Q4Z723_9ACTN|nr:gas vesicle protein GvpG [Nocardioides guangzhouensis]RYP83637.1 gas vesicle protein [Nocardioides guangzhouensis]
MGLITGILGLPLVPVRGTIWVADQVLQQAEEDYYDPGRIRDQLELVERQRQDGTITEDEAAAWEEELIERLMTGQERRRERDSS